MADYNLPPSADLPEDDDLFGPSYPEGFVPQNAKENGQSTRRLELVKSGHRYVFRYCQGDESQFLASLMEMARDPQNPLDMFDAAILSHQLGVRLAKQMEQILKA